jgi:hypothetical protein
MKAKIIANKLKVMAVGEFAMVDINVRRPVGGSGKQ